MSPSLAGFVLAAGAGTRLRPLTSLRPKPLCPVGNVAMVDRAISQLSSVAGDVIVNVHHGRAQMEEHLDGRVQLSVEAEQALGTAGALGHARDLLDSRGAVVVNADAYSEIDLRGVIHGWDGERVRVCTVGGALEPTSQIVASVMPWNEIAALRPEPSGLYEVSWRPALDAGRCDVIDYSGVFVDCGTPTDYLAANLAAAGGAAVVGEGAVVEGTVERSVVWPGASVAASEHLVDAIRLDDRTTVLVR